MYPGRCTRATGGNLIRVKHEESDWLGVALATAAGLGIGLLAGLVAGELLGEVNPARVRRVVGRLRRSEADDVPEDPRLLERAVVAALGENPQTRNLTITARALGDGVVELTGTAPDSEARRLAGKVSRGAPGADVIVNRILVEGDDIPRRHSAPHDVS